MYKTFYVAAIDDNKPDLEKISNALSELGISCRPILYESTGEDIPKIPLLRILFLDLNLAGNTDPIQQAQVISSTLKRISPIGPYAIVIFSATPGNIKDIRERLENGNRPEGVLPPVAFESLDKSNYFSPLEGVATTGEQRQKLYDDIESIIRRNHVITALLQWEARIALAAGHSISGLLKMVMKSHAWNTEPSANEGLAGILHSIACAAAGKPNVDGNQAQAIEEGLLPLLEDRLLRLGDSEGYSALWKEVFTISSREEYSERLAELNRHYLIDQGSVLKKTDRGVWTPLEDSHSNDAEIKKLFGIKSKKGLLSDFIGFPSDFDDPLKETIRNSVRIGFLEISPECDHAQKKITLYRFALCVLIPAAHKSFTFFPPATSVSENNLLEARSPTKHQAIYRFPPVEIGGVETIIEANFRFILGLPEGSSILGKPEFRVRRQVLNEIAYRCSQYLARPGIISFHP